MSGGDCVGFVAGATGYTGREVVRVLAERGATTVAHVRPDSSRVQDWRERFRTVGASVDTTAWSLDAMTATLRELQPTVVFSLLGTTRKRARADGLEGAEAYEKIDYGLTALMIGAAAACGSSPRFVYLSTAGLSETASNPYMKARVKAEADLRASGLPYTIARPSFITGPDRDENRPGERTGAAVGDALLAVAGAFGARRFQDRYRSTSAAELGAALVRAALDPEAENQILHSERLRG